MMIILSREVAKLILILTSGAALLCFVSKQEIPGDTFKVRFKCCIDQGDIRRWYLLQLHIQERVLHRFSKDVDDMYCRIGKTMRQASNMHPNLMLAVVQKI